MAKLSQDAYQDFIVSNNRNISSLLENAEAYGPFETIVSRPDMVLKTDDINKNNWSWFYQGLLNILKDGIETEYIQKYFVRVIFHNKKSVDLSIIDLYFNIIMWRLIVFADEVIMPYHLFFEEELTQNSIKKYIDDHFISENRTKFSNKTLSNIIADTLHCFHDIDQFSDFLANTLNLEDTIELMEKDPEFYRVLHDSFAGLPIDAVKDTINKDTEISIERIKDSKKHLGYDHCLTDAWRADEGISKKQYAEVTIGIGIKPDGRGGIFNSIVDSSFLNGGVSTPVDYFIESSVSRISQIIKYKNVSTSGAFARIMGLNNMDSFLYPDQTYDCGTVNLVPIQIKSEKHLKFLNLRYYREKQNAPEKCIDWRKDKHLIGKTILLRDPCTCASAARGHGVCYKCYGDLAYTEYDSNEQMGINIGRIASELITAKQTQMQLSVKHILEAKIEKIDWCPEFFNFFIMNEDTIQIDPELEGLKDYRILIDPESIELENELDGEEFSDDDDAGIAMAFNEYITEFDVLKVSTGETTHIFNDKEEKLYITNDLNGIIRKKGEPVEGKISIGFNEIKDYPMFVIQIQNIEIIETLNHLKHLYNKSSDVHMRTISDLLQEILDTNIKGNMNIAGVHYSIVLMNQIKDVEDILERPNWNYQNVPYRILTLNEALNSNPAVTISLSYQKVMKMLYTPLTFKKHGASFMDLFFMDKPQLISKGIIEEPKVIVHKPGELYEPITFGEDPTKITAEDPEVINNELDSDE